MLLGSQWIISVREIMRVRQGEGLIKSRKRRNSDKKRGLRGRQEKLRATG